MGITHFEDAPTHTRSLEHLRGRWTLLGDAGGCVGAGVRRIEVPAGAWSTPAHAHADAEEIFYILAGRGLLWQGGETVQVGEGDCIVHLAGGPAHTLHALEDLDVLAFGHRHRPVAVTFPRLDAMLVGGRLLSGPGFDGDFPQMRHEAALGAPALPAEAAARAPNVVHRSAVEGEPFRRGPVARVRFKLSAEAGSVLTGLQYVELDAGGESAPPHCHSAEEEIFVVLGGDGWLSLGEERIALRPGHVVVRPPASCVAHMFTGGAEQGLQYLAYGTREDNDICFYPRSGKISFAGVGVIGRLEQLDYWDGEL